MELYKTEYSTTRGNGKLDKILLNYENNLYYKLEKCLYTSYNNQTNILNVLEECEIDIVLKFGYKENIITEYYISKELEELPNFIKYFIKIECNNDIINIINNNKNISNYKFSYYENKQVEILIMKYYNLGCINDYEWNENNFNILKNVIKQVVFAIIQAYKKKGFIHGDLHCGNVLLKPKKNNIILYESKNLIIDKYEAIIMDFENSKLEQFNNINHLYRNINKFIMSIITSNNMVLNIEYYDGITHDKIKLLMNMDNYYDELEKIIDNMYIFKQ